jgi:hypothetical protein
MAVYLLFILFCLIIEAQNLGCSETEAESYNNECKTYEMRHDLGDNRCCYSEFQLYNDDVLNSEIQKYCVQLSRDQYNNIEQFVKDLNEDKTDYMKAKMLKIDCGSSEYPKSSESSKSFYLVEGLLRFLIVVLIII